MRRISAQRFSAALCRGLIEAAKTGQTQIWYKGWFSAALCRGLIEAPPGLCHGRVLQIVFRGFMPRPH